MVCYYSHLITAASEHLSLGFFAIVEGIPGCLARSSSASSSCSASHLVEDRGSPFVLAYHQSSLIAIEDIILPSSYLATTT